MARNGSGGQPRAKGDLRWADAADAGPWTRAGPPGEALGVNSSRDASGPSPDRARLRADAREVFDAGLRAVEPRAALRAHLRLDGESVMVGSARLPLRPASRVRLVAVGKAAAPMAQEAEAILGPRLGEGIAVTKRGHGAPLERVALRESGHPIPDAAGVAAAQEVERLLADGRPEDLVLCLVSGGASALLPSPAPGLGLAEEQAVAALLLACGADIAEANAVRKHLSRLKGGGLARVARPARVAGLILSDVVGDPLDVVGSGPTVADPTTYSDALAVFARRGLLDRLPPAARARLEAGARGEIPETPKPGSGELAGVPNVLVGTNRIALMAAAARARALGYRTLVLSSTLAGEAREVGGFLAAMARELRASGNPVAPPACLLAGGETTVTLRGHGKGGRNQECALATAIGIAGVERLVVLSAGTDGTDGPTDAAGALVDGETVARAREAGLEARDHLDRNDAYPLLAALGDHVVTGPTRTNVADLMLVLVS
jgi:glycerate 2-kinase